MFEVQCLNAKKEVNLQTVRKFNGQRRWIISKTFFMNGSLLSSICSSQTDKLRIAQIRFTIPMAVSYF